MYSEYPKVYVVTKVRSYRLQVLGYRVQVLGYRAQVPGRCWSQVPGRQAAGAGQVLDRCWGHRSQVPGRQAAGAGQVLGRCWAGAAGAGQVPQDAGAGQVLQDAGAGQVLQVPGRCCTGAGDTGRRCRADRLQVPGRCWAGAGQVWHTGPEVQGISPISPGYLAL